MNLGVKKKNTNQKSHILRAFAVAGAPLFFSLLIQAVLVIELYRNTYNKHVDQTDEPRIVYLQIACLLLWFIDMSADLSLMTRNAMVICAKRYEVDDDIKTIQIPCFFRAMILSLTVLTEFLVWLATIISGSLFLLKAQSAEDLILNAVAIKFVVDVDEIVATSVLPAYAVKTLEDVHIHLPYAPSKKLKPLYGRWQVARAVISHFLKIPLLIGASVGTVAYKSPYFNHTFSGEAEISGTISMFFVCISMTCAFIVMCCKTRSSSKITPL